MLLRRRGQLKIGSTRTTVPWNHKNLTMSRFAKFLSAGSLVFLAAVTSSPAADSDRSYHPGSSGMKGLGNRAVGRYAPEYLRPTQRFYGKGYTVAYRFVPWSDRMRSVNSASIWDSDQMRLPTNAAATTSVNGSSPRITYFYKKPSPAPSPAMGLQPEHDIPPMETPKQPPAITEPPAR